MEYEGRFTSPENLSEVVTRLGDEELSGRLTLRFSTTTTEFQFERGKFYAPATPERAGRLGQILLSRGLVDRIALDEALAYQTDFSPSTPIGRVLLDRDRIAEPELNEAGRLCLEEELMDLLAGTDGFYQFTPNESDESETPSVVLEPATLFAEILNRKAEWESLRDALPNENLVPSVMKIKAGPYREVQQLTEREWQVLSLVNGYYDIGCIAAHSGIGRFATYKSLVSLLKAELIQMKPPDFSKSIQISENTDSTEQSGDSSKDPDGSSSSRWKSLLTRLRDEPDSPPTIDKSSLRFDSPVSFLAEMANQILDRLMSMEDFIVDPLDENIGESYWRQVLMSHPCADLVSAESNTLDADSFDRYIRSLGVGGQMKSIYLETVEALCRYLRLLYLLSAQRLGSRTARSLFVDMMESIKQRSTIGNSEEFFFKEVATRVLE